MAIVPFPSRAARLAKSADEITDDDAETDPKPGHNSRVVSARSRRGESRRQNSSSPHSRGRVKTVEMVEIGKSLSSRLWRKRGGASGAARSEAEPRNEEHIA